MEFDHETMNAFLVATSEREDLGLWAVDLDELSRPRQVFRLIWELEAEVCNGGFAQYAHNSSGVGAPHCAAALKEIGAIATAAIVEQAIDTIGVDTPWHDDDLRRLRAKSLEEDLVSQLSKLDQAFFRYDDNLTAILFAYVVQNLSEFPPPSS